jgi:hypothetical protein
MMALKQSFGLPLAILLLASLGSVEAQTAPSRLSGDWRSSGAVAISTSKANLQSSEADLGAAPSGQQLNRMLLLLAPSAAEQQALTAELAALENPQSSSYHQWLTPSAFADAYSNSASDVAQLTAWLQSEGFQVAPLPAGRGWIEFSGTVAQVEQAFQTHIDSISTPNGTRSVLMSSITVPSALSPLIAGLASLDGALATPALTAPHPLTVSAADLAAESSLGSLQALTPHAVAQLLHFDTLQSSGIDGKGQTIAIATRSDVNLADVASFRSSFGLPAAVLQVLPNGSDPGFTADQAEATFAASWSGAAAPGASILLVPAATTSATDGIDLSLAAIVDQDLAHTVAIGFSDCEAGLSSAHQAFYSALYQQAAAEGIAIVSAVGDSGSAACHLAGSTTPVSTGYAVNALASTPWNTAVGVASYGASGPAAGSTALAAWSPLTTADPAYAGGGGNSTLYTGPSWQPVPASAATQTISTGLASGKRLLPDLALPTALDSGANRGLAFCFSGSSSASGCTLQRTGGSAAAASLFAGIAALVDQQHGTQGNLAPGLYALRTQSGAYTDVAQGSAQLACAAGSSGCGSNGQIGYSASAGYDLATGLGVPNASTLVQNFAQPEAGGTQAASINLVVTPTETNSTYNPSASVTVTVTVLSETGGSQPTGTVTFYDSTTGLSLSPPETINTNTGVASVNLEGVFQLGGNEMIAEYSGDTNYAAINSTPPINVNIQASTTSLVVQPSTSSVTPGQSISVTVTLTVGSPPSGTVNPAGVITLNLDGGAEVYTAPLVTSSGVTTATFSSVTVPANSTLTTHTLQAVYNGNTDYVQSTSPQISLTVTASTPTITLTPATTTPTPGSSLLLTAAVSPQVPGETPPTGTVTFTLDGSTVGSSNLAPQSPSSLGTLTITVPNTTGNHTLQVRYGGDGFYNPVTSAQIIIDVTARSTATTVSPATTTPTAGGALQVSATISASSYGTSGPTGTVNFTIDGTTVASVTVNSAEPATASTTITAPTSGSHTLAAVYSGDSNYAGSTSSGVTLTIAKTTTTISITPSTTTPTAGSTLQVTADISPSATLSTPPSGTVTIMLDGVSEGTATVTSGSPATATLSFTVPTTGTHTLTATYSGDTNYSSSTTTSSVTINVSKSTPTVVVTPATLSPGVGSTLQLTASISPPSSGGTAPSGTVNFTLDGTPVGTALVTSGSPSTATLTINTPAIGSHTIQASYSGDGNYNTASSSVVTINVGRGSTTLTVTPATTSPLGGSTMLVTATLSTGSTALTTVPTGTITFTLDGSTVGSGSVVNGTTASINITVPTSGIHALQASYSGDTNFISSVSPVINFTVAKTPTTLVLTPSTTSPALGSTLPITATISPSSLGSTQPSGTVTFTVDGVTTAVQGVTPGSPSTSSVTLPALSPGSHTLAAIYSGDSYYASSTATSVTVTVPKSPTAIIVTPAAISLTGGGVLSVSASITATALGTSYPTGTVTFTIDGASAGTAAVVPGVPATASANLASITPGTHVLAATYSGDSYYGSSTSSSTTITVSKSPSTITIIPSTLTPTAGGSMIVTADITSANPSTTYPSGTVTIDIDGVAAATASVTTGSPSIASVTLPLVSAGTHVLEGTYSGDTYYTSSNSLTVDITASKGATTTTLAATPATLTAGSDETLTATIAPVNAIIGVTYTITGTVSFYDGSTLLGKVAVVNDTATLSNLALKDNISHSLTAVYSGDTNWVGSTSTVLPLAASTLPDYVVLTSNFTKVQPGVAVVLTATVTPSSTPLTTGETNPTGLVIFYDGTTIIGQSALTPVALTDTSTATLTIQTLPGGNDVISAYYEGDQYYDAATSNLLSLTIEAFTITPDPSNPATNINIVQGASGAVTFDITGEGGFNNEVQIVCASLSQDNMTCTASPQQITPPGTVTFVVQTYKSNGSTGGGTIISQRGSPPGPGIGPRIAGGAALAFLLGFFLLPFGFGRRASQLLDRYAGNSARRLIILLLLLAGLGGAGIGCTSTTNLTSTSSGATPLGVATLKVTGSAYVDNTVVSQSVYFTVNVTAP